MYKVHPNCNYLGEGVQGGGTRLPCPQYQKMNAIQCQQSICATMVIACHWCHMGWHLAQGLAGQCRCCTGAPTIIDGMSTAPVHCLQPCQCQAKAWVSTEAREGYGIIQFKSHLPPTKKSLHPTACSRVNGHSGCRWMLLDAVGCRCTSCNANHTCPLPCHTSTPTPGDTQ